MALLTAEEVSRLDKGGRGIMRGQWVGVIGNQVWAQGLELGQNTYESVCAHDVFRGQKEHSLRGPGRQTV